MKIERNEADGGLLPMTACQSRTGRSALRARLIWTSVVLLALAAMVWGVVRSQGATEAKGPGTAAPGPVPVVAATVGRGDIDIALDALGTVTPLATVTVKPRIAGHLTQVAFREGQVVKAGDLLAQIDPRPYERQLEQYEGQLSKDKAALKAAEVDLERYRTLVAQDSLARQTQDTQEATVQQDRATVATDQAQVDNAKLNLIYCRIESPITGRAGLRQVDPGNYVQTSDTAGIVVITQMSPISVLFTLAEDDLPAVMGELRNGAKLAVTAYNRNKTARLAVGTLTTVDNQVDTGTGTVKLRAQFGNEDEMLFPNQFVNVRLRVKTMRESTLIPTAAVQRGAPGTFSYLVGADNKVSVRHITLGTASGDQVAVLSGLQPGDKVVVDGADRLREGTLVSLAADAQRHQDQ
ncbi:efflux RND transporter periplasmic adaptor subunit [Telmatospirillum siberiense]|uniref:Multidrug transporter subunit MdtA n=1 Tax=Telmatospirillum siberiense TaxID=382514 RepID=A0A2N3PUM5_9PROT|nr:efflux RND transporter periplasmic adaptor subunit [Telmatospirillum siberiense]PKU24105.1 multidrug transporter subunit MdtA [Telmatospirillum siberiense]